MNRPNWSILICHSALSDSEVHAERGGHQEPARLLPVGGQERWPRRDAAVVGQHLNEQAQQPDGGHLLLRLQLWIQGE